jgi:hypothetical protein
MVASQFIEELRSIQHLYAWKFQSDGNWPGNRRWRPRLRIRASLDESADSPVLDPIGAVCFAKTGRLFNAESWIQAADAIELSLIDAADITAAANDRTWKAEGDGRVMNSYLVSLRKRLMNSVGLADHKDRAASCGLFASLFLRRGE